MTPEEKEEIVQMAVEAIKKAEERSPSASVKDAGSKFSLLFATILTGFLIYSIWSYERKGDRLPVHIAVPVIGFIGAALGVQVSPEVIGKLIGSNQR